MNENIYKFFQDNLNDVTAKIYLGSASMEGHMEGECLLKVHGKFQGVYVYSELKWNESNAKEVIQQATVDIVKQFGYDILDKVREKLFPVIENQWVRIGTIRPYGIKDISSSFHDKKLYSVNITYEDGTICKIVNIKPVKKEK